MFACELSPAVGTSPAGTIAARPFMHSERTAPERRGTGVFTSISIRMPRTHSVTRGIMSWRRTGMLACIFSAAVGTIPAVMPAARPFVHGVWTAPERRGTRMAPTATVPLGWRGATAFSPFSPVVHGMASAHRQAAVEPVKSTWFIAARPGAHRSALFETFSRLLRQVIMQPIERGFKLLAADRSVPIGIETIEKPFQTRVLPGTVHRSAF